MANKQFHLSKQNKICVEENMENIRVKQQEQDKKSENKKKFK